MTHRTLRLIAIAASLAALVLAANAHAKAGGHSFGRASSGFGHAMPSTSVAHVTVGRSLGHPFRVHATRAKKIKATTIASHIVL